MPELSAAEALVLLKPRDTSERDVLRAGFMEILARGYIKMWKNPHDATEIRLAVRPGAAERLDPASVLFPIVRAAIRACGRSGWTNPKFVVAHLAPGSGNEAAFRRDTVVPSLVSQGLIEETEQRVLFFIKRRIHRLTPAGVDAQKALRGKMKSAKLVARTINFDTNAALALAATLGPMVLLEPSLQQYLQEVTAGLRRSDNGRFDQSGTSSTESFSGDDRERDSWNSEGVPAIAADLDFSSTFDDDIDYSTGFDAVAAGFDSGSFSDGGDGGSESGGGGDGPDRD